MKLGIKVGLKSDWKADLGTTQPSFCEFWFHAGKIPEYEPLFSYCKAQNIETGLHYWGMTPEGLLTNLAYPDKEILRFSRQLVRDTIDAASAHESAYVNIHPTQVFQTKVDFEKEQFTPLGDAIPLTQALPILKESLSELAAYAETKGVLFTVESVPLLAMGHPWRGKEGRLRAINIGEIVITDLEKIMPIRNVYFANDFGHTAASMIFESRSEIKDYLFDIARRLAPYTKLLHVGYIVPPYNGTDYHGGLYYDEFETDGALPNRDEMKQLLKLFVHRPDVFALVEPEIDHPKNFAALKKLVQEIS